MESLILITILLSFVSMMYKDFSLFFLMVFLLTSVVTQYILIIGTISLLSSNILMSIGLSILYWILGVVLVASSDKLTYVAVFDASNLLYSHIDQVFVQGSNFISLSNVLTVIVYNGILFVMSVLISKLMNKRWLKLGID